MKSLPIILSLFIFWSCVSTRHMTEYNTMKFKNDTVELCIKNETLIFIETLLNGDIDTVKYNHLDALVDHLVGKGELIIK